MTTQPTPIDDAKLAELVELEKKATPGPWHWSSDFKSRAGDSTWSLIGGGGYGVLSCDGCANSPQRCNPADGDLIVAIRNAAPSLIRAAAEVKRLRESIEKADAALERKEAENMRLRGALAFYADPVQMNEFLPRRPGICVKAREALKGGR